MGVDDDIRRLEAKLDAILESAALARWLSVRRAAAYAGMSANSMRQAISEGRVRATKRPIGGWIVDRLSIDEYNSGPEGENDLYRDVARRAGL